MFAPDLAAYDAVMRWGRMALAWEVLRRDPAYIADYAAHVFSGAFDAPANGAFAARWGLHFR
jgi:hypothetical protein